MSASVNRSELTIEARGRLALNAAESAATNMREVLRLDREGDRADWLPIMREARIAARRVMALAAEIEEVLVAGGRASEIAPALEVRAAALRFVVACEEVERYRPQPFPELVATLLDRAGQLAT